MNPTAPAAPVPRLTTEQMIEVDHAMIEDFTITLLQMMENAGRCLATLARARFLGGDPRGQRVIVLAGTGGNGGGALVAARRLSQWGAQVEVFLSASAERMTPVPGHQLGILQRTGATPIHEAAAPGEAAEAALIVDGVIGYSLKGEPRGVAAAMIRWANAHPAPTLALDVPSGVDAGTGRVFDPAIEADATLTLALPKEGLYAQALRERVGELWLGDISVPPELYSRPPLLLDVGPIFALGDLVRLA